MINRKIFQKPWGYLEAFLLVIILIAFALIVEISTDFKPITLPSWPYNLQIAVSYIILLIFVNLIYKNTLVVRWLSSIPASISALVFFITLSLAIGLFPHEDIPGKSYFIVSFSNLQKSWYFIASVVFLLTSLGLVILRRALPFNKRNLGFLANHVGLWLIIFAGSLGSGDRKSFQINLEEGKPNQIGCNQEDVCFEFPFSLKLLNFHIDDFPAKVALVKNGADKIDTKIKNNLFLLEKNVEKEIKDYKIKVEEYLPLSVYDSVKGFVSSKDTGAAPAALLSVRNKNNEFIIEGWISCGSFNVKPAIIGLEDKYFLLMTNPDPKKFSSTIEIVSKNGKKLIEQIRVNKPLSISGWKLYQMSYDLKMGRYSKISIIDAIKDPWLPIVYLGVLLLMAGSVYIFWTGRNIKSDNIESIP
jgi:ResB-like family